MPNTTQRNCIVYARTKKDEETLRKQVQCCRDYAHRHGFTVIDVVTAMPESELFGDPLVKQLTERKLAQDDFATLVIFDPTRLSRHPFSLNAVLGALKTVGITVVSVVGHLVSKEQS